MKSHVCSSVRLHCGLKHFPSDFAGEAEDEENKLFQLLRINVMKIAHDHLKCPFNFAIKCQLIHVKLSRKMAWNAGQQATHPPAALAVACIVYIVTVNMNSLKWNITCLNKKFPGPTRIVETVASNFMIFLRQLLARDCWWRNMQPE